MPALDDVADRDERFQGSFATVSAARQADRAHRLLRLLTEAVERLTPVDPAAAARIVATLEEGRLCLNSFGQAGSLSTNHRCTLFAGHGGDCVFATRGAKNGDYPVSPNAQRERLELAPSATSVRPS